MDTHLPDHRLDYADTKLAAAVELLTEGRGTLRRRLAAAWNEVHPVDEDALPPLAASTLQHLRAHGDAGHPPRLRGALFVEARDCIRAALEGAKGVRP
jgi:hypothetical protein